MTRLLDDPTIGAALQTDLGAATHRAAYDVEAGLTRFEHRRADARPQSTPTAEFQQQHHQNALRSESQKANAACLAQSG